MVSPTFQRVNTGKPLPSGRYSGKVGASLHTRYHCDKSIKNGRLTNVPVKEGLLMVLYSHPGSGNKVGKWNYREMYGHTPQKNYSK